MRVSEAMTHQVCVAHPRQSIRDAARVMAEIDAGVLPVGEDGRLVGMITDRDIAVRAVAQGKGPYTAVRDVMTVDVKYCYEDEDVGHVARNMGDIRVRRLPVVDREKRLVGIIALGDLAVAGEAAPATVAITGISQPGGDHCQSHRRERGVNSPRAPQWRPAA